MKTTLKRGAPTRLRILEAASDLVYKKGVNGTSVDDVLAASGTGKSQFYHYFSSKEGLVKELIHFQLAKLPSMQPALLEKLGTVEGIQSWLDQILTDYGTGLYSQGSPIGNLANELASQNENLRSDLQSIFSHWENCLTSGLKSLQSLGTVRSDAVADELATYWVAAIEGALLLAKTQQSQAPLKATLSQVKNHLKSMTVGATAKKRPSPHRGILFNCP